MSLFKGQWLAYNSRADTSRFRLREKQNGFDTNRFAVDVTAIESYVIEVFYGADTADNKLCSYFLCGKSIVEQSYDITGYEVVLVEFPNHFLSFVDRKCVFLFSLIPIPITFTSIKVSARSTTE